MFKLVLQGWYREYCGGVYLKYPQLLFLIFLFDMYVVSMMSCVLTYRDNFILIFVLYAEQTDVGANNNKYYIIQLLEEIGAAQYHVWQRWGRVGYKGQSNLASFGNGFDSAMQIFAKKLVSGHIFDYVVFNCNVHRAFFVIIFHVYNEMDFWSIAY